MKIFKLAAYIILGVLISGCASAPKTLNPVSPVEQPAPVEHVKVVQETETTVVAEVVPQASTVPEQQIEAQGADIVSSVPAEARAEAGITYSQVTNLISEFIDMQPVESSSGQPRFSGISENDLVAFEIAGDKNNITYASMRLAYPEDISPLDADLNSAMMLRFLRNSAPESEEWPATVESITNTFYSMQGGTVKQDEIMVGRKVIDILYDKKKDSITLTLKFK